MHNRRFGLFAAQSSLLVRHDYTPRLGGIDLPYTGRADGAARVGATLFSELLNAVFANVGQRAVRTVARQTFEHLLNLDLKFHLSRQTGGLTRSIDRGTKCVLYLLSPPQLCLGGAYFVYSYHNDRGVTFILQAVLFRVVPTALEISLVCGILVRQ